MSDKINAIILLNLSSASAGLKHGAILPPVWCALSSKPVFGFGWIETVLILATCKRPQMSSKPVFGFGWIETILVCVGRIHQCLLNPSSASAGLKLVIKSRSMVSIKYF